MPWIREGSCNQCGKCCLNEMFYRPMLNASGRCLYLIKTETGYRCAIRIDPTGIPKDHLKYWKRECAPYPNPKNPAHTPPIHKLMKGCGFRMVEIDGK